MVEIQVWGGEVPGEDGWSKIPGGWSYHVAPAAPPGGGDDDDEAAFHVLCHCTAVNSSWNGNPHGHDVLCPAYGLDIPNRSPYALGRVTAALPN